MKPWMILHTVSSGVLMAAVGVGIFFWLADSGVPILLALACGLAASFFIDHLSSLHFRWLLQFEPPEDDDEAA